MVAGFTLCLGEMMNPFSRRNLSRIGLCALLPVMLAGCDPYYDGCGPGGCGQNRTQVSTGVIIGSGGYREPARRPPQGWINQRPPQQGNWTGRPNNQRPDNRWPNGQGHNGQRPDDQRPNGQRPNGQQAGHQRPDNDKGQRPQQQPGAGRPEQSGSRPSGGRPDQNQQTARPQTSAQKFPGARKPERQDADTSNKKKPIWLPNQQQ